MLRKFLFIVTALAVESAYPIGRIGNQLVGDPIDRYTIKLPADFRSVTFIADGGLVLESGLFASNPAVPVDIQILPFRSQFPELVGKGQDAIEAYFIGSPNTRYQRVQPLNGILGLVGEGKNSYIGTAVCGDGRGYVVFAPKLAITKNGIHEILRNTMFESPCTMK